MFPELDTEVSGLERDWLTLHGLPNGCVLYHFTPPGRLCGILRSGAIRATLATDFKDKSELRHPTTSLEEAETIPDTWKQPWWKGLGSDYVHDPIWESVEAWRKVKGPFVGCFCNCRPEDYASSEYMWNAYAERGTGFALGIRFIHSERPAGVLGSVLRRVLYGESQWVDLLTRVSLGNRRFEVFRKRVERARLIDARGLPEGILNPGIEERKRRETAEIDRFQARLHRLQMELAACAKKIDYSQEQETRLLVYQVQRPLTGKNADGEDVSYINIPVGNLRPRSSIATDLQIRLELVEIVVGPNADHQLAKKLTSPRRLPAFESVGVSIRHIQLRS